MPNSVKHLAAGAAGANEGKLEGQSQRQPEKKSKNPRESPLTEIRLEVLGKGWGLQRMKKRGSPNMVKTGEGWRGKDRGGAGDYQLTTVSQSQCIIFFNFPAKVVDLRGKSAVQATATHQNFP